MKILSILFLVALLASCGTKIKEYTRISELETENAQLKEELKFKWKIIFKDNMCYKEWDDNAYCSSCYWDKNKFIYLHLWEYSHTCPLCKISVSSWKTRPKSRPIRPNIRKFI